MKMMPEFKRKSMRKIWCHANMLKHVAPIPAIAEEITDTPDALLPMIKMDPETFLLPPFNSVVRKWFGSTSSTVISFESKKKDDGDNDNDDLEDAKSHKKNGKKSKAAYAKTEVQRPNSALSNFEGTQAASNMAENCSLQCTHCNKHTS